MLRDVAIEIVDLVKHPAEHLDIHRTAAGDAELVESADAAAQIGSGFFDGEKTRDGGHKFLTNAVLYRGRRPTVLCGPRIVRPSAHY
jgi:hypothetical protein